MTSAANQRYVSALKTSEKTVDLALQSLNGVVDVVSESPSSSVAINDSFGDDSLPNVGLEPSHVSAEILERLQPIYERLSRQSPTRPDIILQMVDASIQLARIQHTLGRTPDSIETLNSSVALLDDRGQSASISNDDLQLRLARLNNDLGGMHAAEFHRELSNACYVSAIDAASKLNDSNDAGQIELARAHLNAGYRPPHLRRDESLIGEQRADDLAHVNRAIQILQNFKVSQQSTTIKILHARSLLARSRFSQTPREKHLGIQEAVSILRGQLDETPDDTNARFELVATLADVNIRGLRSQSRLNEASERLHEALNEIANLRFNNPDNALFLVSEIHLRHKLSAIARTQSRFDDADAMLSEAIRLQSSLIEKWPDSVMHRCCRATLYRSRATMYGQWDKPEAAKDAITGAIADIEAIDAKFYDHPLVNRTRDAVDRLSDTPPQ